MVKASVISFVTPVDKELNEVDIELSDVLIVELRLSFNLTISAFKFAISSLSLSASFVLDLIFKYKIINIAQNIKIKIINKIVSMILILVTLF